jgi:hypothetical protein
VAFYRGLRETDDVRRGELGNRFADEIGGFAPTASQRQRDIVPGNARLLRNLGSGFASHILRVNRTVFKGVLAIVRHPSILDCLADAPKKVMGVRGQWNNGVRD